MSALEQAELVAGNIVLKVPGQPSTWDVLDAMLFDQRRFVEMGKAATASMFVRREFFDRLGGFDQSLPSGGDWAFAELAVGRGGRLAFAAESVVEHETRGSARDFLGRRWRIEHNAARRAIWRGQSLVGFNTSREPVVRRRWGFAVGYDKHRLIECGLPADRRRRVSTLPARYLIVPAVDGLAQLTGMLRSLGSSAGSSPPVEQPSSPTAGP